MEDDGEPKKKRCTCLAKGSTFSMVVFVFFEVCCFQLSLVRNQLQLNPAQAPTRAPANRAAHDGNH